MGQSFSTNGQKPTDSAEQNTEKKVDYYELLQVEQNASGEEIKKAYRKKALELHPDRNYGNVEAATRLFAEIQSAYEVLSDPQERAWYDSHRDAFLGNGGKSETNDYSYDSRMTTSDDILKLFSKFSPRMDFSDSQSGFYGGLRETFARLAMEEEMACRSDNIEFIDYPTFGFRDDDFEDIVRPFYAVWSGFSTKKSFAWKDVYRYSEAPDRRVRRLMEKENRRLREEGIREFNEAIRSLIAFIKKRDPRYKSNAQSESQRQETLRQTAAAQAARSRAANQAKLRDHVMPDWAKSEVLEEDDTDSSEAEIEQQFECVVCCKDFKSLNQLEAHERSKKHIKAVKQLRWEMRAQDEQLDLNEDALNYGNKPQTWQGDDTNSTVPPQSNLEYSISQPVDDGSFNNAAGLNTQFGVQNSQNEYDASSTSIDISTDDSASYIITPGDDAVEYTPGGLVHDRQESETVSTQEESDADTINSLSQHFSASDIKESPSSAPQKIGKAKQKRARKAAQQAMEQSADVKCSTCNASFPSRTQLFSHIKKFNHAKPQGGVPGHKKP